MPWMVSAPWVLIRHLRTIMASASDPQGKLDKIVKAIAANMIAEVSSIYVSHPDGSLELFATEGLRREAVHQLKMAKGEGLVGVIANYGEPVNLADAQKHPAFSYKPETGENAFHSFLGVPILRDRRTLGVLTVQNKIERRYSDEEVEALQTTAMVLAEMLSSSAFADTVVAVPDKRGLSQNLKGVPIGDGLALGHIALHEPKAKVVRFLADNVGLELQRLDAALDALKLEIDELVKRSGQNGTPQRAILEAVQMLASGKGWARRMRDSVSSAGVTAEAAVEQEQRHMRSRMTPNGDPFWRERLHDLDDLANRLLRHLNGSHAHHDLDLLPGDAILVAKTMSAAELLDYDTKKVRGLVIEDGGATSHVAIVARALGLATLLQVKSVLSVADHGDPAILDGETGLLHLRPSLELIRAYADKARFRARRQKRFMRLRIAPSVTGDGERVQLNMNAGLLVDLTNLHQSGADGIGLFRTELQFMIASKFPKMHEQQEIYSQILDEAKGRRVVFRSLDIGGDKVLPYLKEVIEENPALGWRAIRMSLDRPGLFRTQVRALLRAAAGRELSLMIPFVAQVFEFIQAKALIDKEVAHARLHGHALPQTMRIGVMLEVPALVYQLDALLPLVDFISVGSNDLLQFLFAADRENERVSRRFDPLSCSSLRILHEIAVKASVHGTDFSLCGEMAGRPIEAMALIGLGYRSISMSAASIGPVKAMVRSVDAVALREYLLDRLDSHSPDIRQDLVEFAKKRSIDI